MTDKEEQTAQKTATEPDATGDAAKTEEDQVTEAAQAELEKELEEDAPADPRPAIDADSIRFNVADTTLNVLSVAQGKLLTGLSEGGLQYLLAAARASVGLRAGRYMFEAKIVESLSPSEPQGNTLVPRPRQLLRVGVALAGSSLILATGKDNVCFDSEGHFVHDKTKKRASQQITRGQVIALLVNLDAKSRNANTVSLFRDGVRISEPQALPENLCGKVLYPTVTYKNVTVQVNFGPSAIARLPFQSRMLAAAAKEDVEISAPAVPKDGKHDVLFPVGLPEQGFFDWVDAFVEMNPSYTELSDRKIIEWASKSGIWRPKAQGVVSSNDKPSVKFGIPMMDDMSIRKVLNAVAPSQARSYIIPELKSNLISSERRDSLIKFSAPQFKKTATVIMGEPSDESKERVHSLLLADKKAEAAAKKKAVAQEQERRRLLQEKKKKAEEARKLKEIAQKKKEGKEVEEEPKQEEAAEEAKEDAPEEEAAPMELAEEEKKLWYRKLDAPDILERTLAKTYAGFSLPSKAEGFDEISYAWQGEAHCAELLQRWILGKKLMQPAEELQPGPWFKEEWSKWQKTLQEWRKMQTEWKDPAKRKAALAKRQAEAKKRKGGEGDHEEEAKPMEVSTEDVHASSVQDVTDLGSGEPLFANFAYEDWALLSARYELHLLLHAFKKDLNDPDRPSFREDHVAFYYYKYFKKPFNLKYFSVERFAGFVELIKDTIAVGGEKAFLSALLPEDAPAASFAKLAEADRRERQRRMDAGDEIAKIKFTRPAPVAPKQPAGAPADRAAARPASSGHGSSGQASSAQKRPHAATSSAPLSKQQRTGSVGHPRPQTPAKTGRSRPAWQRGPGRALRDAERARQHRRTMEEKATP